MANCARKKTLFKFYKNIFLKQVFSATGGKNRNVYIL